jgi:hypothetical protein
LAPIGVVLPAARRRIFSETFRLRTKRFTISASFLAIVLAMTLLGPAPAALLGVVSMGISDLRRRVSLRHALVNVLLTPASRSSVAGCSS